MESSKTKITTLSFIFILVISSLTPILGCGHCKNHKKKPIIVSAPPPPIEDATTCPIDTIKLGACVDLLGGLVHIGIGNPVVNGCCTIIQGLVEIEAAVCLCTTLKLKLLNLNLYVPLALQLLLTCGKTPPPGYTCSL
ncbi:putative lipid-binding protein [Capsicum annuum]|uniref:Lipid-binding protein n=1 Tax=Capsicum annuum TaxID=4072 RepID=A0A1U8H5T2_CAPAN|nr:putative lipid-binding protein [Capsicum annuum]KAF3684367.1 putative lipid-binding protein [Capsicum annuum]PHT75552.1 putative lipid-binding protein [Capsicum annuum]